MKKWFILILSAGALSAAVEDRGKLFSPQTIAAANESLHRVKSATGKEILILTVNDMGGKTIVEFSREEGLKRRLNGVILLISKNPRQLEIMAGRKTTLVFNKQHRDKVVEMLSKNLRKNADGALTDAVKYLSDVFLNANSAMLIPDSQRDTAPAQAQKVSGSFSWLKWLVIIGVVFLVIRLISWFIASRSNSTAGVPGNMSGASSSFGGGGFFSSLIGGIFGAVAGNWLYDRFFGGSDHSTGHDSSSHGNGNDSWRGDDAGDIDSDSGSGGDWGGDGGSDGGGDSGGSW